MNDDRPGGLKGWRRRRAARKAEGRRRWEQSRKERADGVITVPCRFLGSTKTPPALAQGQSCWLKLGIEALELRPEDGGPVLTLPWRDVADIAVEEASEMRVGTQVEHHAYGWFGGLFRLMPVGMTESSKRARSYMGVQSREGEFLFELDWEAATLRGHLLRTKPHWGQVESDEA